MFYDGDGEGGSGGREGEAEGEGGLTKNLKTPLECFSKTDTTLAHDVFSDEICM